MAVFLLLRVIADTTDGAAWLRWLTPLGWTEELRPFTNSQPLVLLIPIAAIAVLLVVPPVIGRNRDIGSGLITTRDEAEPRLRLLSSPLAQALRTERGSLAVWSSCVGAFGLILGIISESVSSAGIPKNFQREIAKLGSGSIITPMGYVSFVFFFFVLAVSLFACAQLAATRREEADQQLETLLAQPVGRTQWLGGRIAIATAGTAVIAIASGVFTWLGATSVGVDVPVGRLIEAGANCIPVALLFLGLGMLAYGALPRASTAISYGVVVVTFLWEAVGSLLGAPRWVVDLTPFAWVGLLPAQPFRTTAAIVMMAIGLGAVLIGLGAFRCRDLQGA